MGGMGQVNLTPRIKYFWGDTSQDPTTSTVFTECLYCTVYFNLCKSKIRITQFLKDSKNSIFMIRFVENWLHYVSILDQLCT